MKKANKLLALVLAAALCLGLSLPAMAANSEGVTFKAQLDHATLNISDQDQTVTMTVSASKTVAVSGVQGTITNDPKLTLTSITNDVLKFDPEEDVYLPNGTFVWYKGNVTNVDTTVLVVATFTVPANTPAGSYTVGVEKLVCAQGSGDKWETGAAASATLTLVDPSHREPQTITAADVEMTYGDTDKKIDARAIGQITYAVKAGSEDLSLIHI